MSFNLRNRSLLTVQDYTQREFRYLLDLARDLKRAKYARTEQKHLDGQRDLPHLREDLDPYPVRIRGRLSRSGGQRHLPGSGRFPDRSQGIVQGHGARARADVRRSRVSRRLAARHRAARPVRGCPGLQRTHGRVPPDADARRCHDHARAQRQADLRDQVCVYRRYPIQHGTLVDDRGLPDGNGCPHLRPEEALAHG